MADFDDELDATGLNCPLPILRAKKALNGLETGKVLRIIATDPGSVKDFEAFAKQTGNELMSSAEEDGKFTFLMRKGCYSRIASSDKKAPANGRGFFLRIRNNWLEFPVGLRTEYIDRRIKFTGQTVQPGADN